MFTPEIRGRLLMKGLIRKWQKPLIICLLTVFYGCVSAKETHQQVKHQDLKQQTVATEESDPYAQKIAVSYTHLTLPTICSV